MMLVQIKAVTLIGQIVHSSYWSVSWTSGMTHGSPIWLGHVSSTMAERRRSAGSMQGSHEGDDTPAKLSRDLDFSMIVGWWSAADYVYLIRVILTGSTMIPTAQAKHHPKASCQMADLAIHHESNPQKDLYNQLCLRR